MQKLVGRGAKKGPHLMDNNLDENIGGLWDMKWFGNLPVVLARNENKGAINSNDRWNGRQAWQRWQAGSMSEM